MAIRVAFATATNPSWDLPAAASLAKAAGYQGLEISSQAAASAQAVREAGLEVACLATGIALHLSDAAAWERSRAELLSAIETAASLQAPVVRVLAYEMAKGEGLAGCVGRIADRLRGEVLDAAADRGVSLAVQNGGAFARARDMWMLMDAVNHPRLGVCWDVGVAALAGESPLLSVPTLNTKILHVHVWDHKDGKPVALGTGEVKLKQLIERLRGIGYERWLSVAPPPSPEAEEIIRKAVDPLKDYLGLTPPPAPAAPAAPAAGAAKPAAPAAAKPAAGSAGATPAVAGATAAPAKPASAAAKPGSDSDPTPQGAPASAPPASLKPDAPNAPKPAEVPSTNPAKP